MPDNHGQRETAIFLAFAASAGLDAQPGSVEKRDPPEPDILWRPGGNRSVAFELVEVIDQGYAERTWAQIKLMRSLEISFLGLEPQLRAAINARHEGALVHVVFNEAATLTSKHQSIESLMRTLAALPPGWKGQLRRRDGAVLPTAISEVRLQRTSASGVHFDVDADGSLADPTVSAIRGKWAKHYTSGHPMELLAYYELQPESHEALWRPDLEDFLRENQSTSPFRKVWLFDRGSSRVRFSSETIGRDQLNGRGDR